MNTPKDFFHQDLQNRAETQHGGHCGTIFSVVSTNNESAKAGKGTYCAHECTWLIQFIQTCILRKSIIEYPVSTLGKNLNVKSNLTTIMTQSESNSRDTDMWSKLDYLTLSSESDIASACNLLISQTLWILMASHLCELQGHLGLQFWHDSWRL